MQTQIFSLRATTKASDDEDIRRYEEMVADARERLKQHVSDPHSRHYDFREYLPGGDPGHP